MHKLKPGDLDNYDAMLDFWSPFTKGHGSGEEQGRATETRNDDIACAKASTLCMSS